MTAAAATGCVGLAFRAPDGAVTAQERILDASLPWLRHPKSFTGDADHVRGHLGRPAEQGITVDAPLAPVGGGLVVFDHAAGALLSMSARGACDSFSLREALDCLQRPAAHGPQAGLLRALLEDCRLSLRTRAYGPRGEEVTLAPIKGGMDEVWALADAWYGRVLNGGKRPGPPSPRRRQDLRIDTRPLEFSEFPASAEGAAALLERLRRSGFDICPAAEAAWRAWQSPRPVP